MGSNCNYDFVTTEEILKVFKMEVFSVDVTRNVVVHTDLSNSISSSCPTSFSWFCFRDLALLLPPHAADECQSSLSFRGRDSEVVCCNSLEKPAIQLFFLTRSCEKVMVVGSA